MDGDVVAVERVIPAGPAAIFALLADAARHPEIDGSGTVRQVKPDTTHQLGPGSTFGMSMKMGVPYSMESTVIEFEDCRRIAWQSRRPASSASSSPAGSGGTNWNRSRAAPWSAKAGTSAGTPAALLKLGGLPTKTAANMARTLERIEEIVTTT